MDSKTESEIKTAIPAATPQWKPENIVNLIGEIAWPIAFLIILFVFKKNISKIITDLFSKNPIAELTAGASGITAKFHAENQKNETNNFIPNDIAIKNLKELQDKDKSQYVINIKQEVDSHLKSLGVDNEEQIELLSTEVSILKAVINYLTINKILFRSQFNFMSLIYQQQKVSFNDLEEFFNVLTNQYPDTYKDWTYVTYFNYPIKIGLVKQEESILLLTEYGKAYIEFMNQRPAEVQKLASI